MAQIKRASDRIVKIIEKQNSKGTPYYELFSTMLDYFIHLLSHGQIPRPNNSEWCEAIQGTLDDYEPFSDMLGNIYEEIAGRGHKSHMGQFFTPDNIAEMMAMMVIAPDAAERQTPMRIAEPCSGSGVMVLKSAKLLQKYRYMHKWYCSDLDMTCVKMTLVQCGLNVIPAYVVHMNALSLEVFSGYEVQVGTYNGVWVPKLVKLEAHELDVFARSKLGEQMQQAAKSQQEQATLFDLGKVELKAKVERQKKEKKPNLGYDQPTLF